VTPIPRPFFVTGASGFIGRRVVAALARSAAGAVVCLERRPGSLAAAAPGLTGCTTVSGSLLESAALADRVPRGSVIVHLAGAVGKQRPAAYERDNVEGTRRILQLGVDRDAAHLVFVSSIAATYPDRRFYPYAQSKVLAEDVVRHGAIPWTIVRPTLVFGPGSAGQHAFERLALLPVPVLFGAGDREADPVHVDDVAHVIARAAIERWAGDTVDVGGPERVSLRELIARIRAVHGRPGRAPLRLPLTTLRYVLAVLEPVLRPVLPFTAGQLAVFANASTAAPHPRLDGLRPSMRTLRDMLAPST
jgi:NADH dehydrogenase